jgi:CelD/BcsL family acetyltransferase involved in cellulose biosynthesis
LSFDTFLRRTARRDNYLRRKKWFEHQSGYQIEREGNPTALARPLAEFFRLHQLRWAAFGGSQGIEGAAAEGFHREAAALLAERGQLCFYTLRLGGQALASVYAILHGSKFIFYQSGFDPAWSKKSVGLVILGETFKDAIESGFTEYDFLHGTEPYKAEWATEQRRTISVRIVQRGSAGEWLDRQQRAEMRLRGVVKRALPRRWIDFLRAWRRRSGS